jgi:hypothetical protein
MLKQLSQDKWLMLILSLGFVVYTGWAIFVVVTDRPLDYYAYVIGADALWHGQNIYLMSGDEYAPIAQRLGITNYAPPYRYPPLTALTIVPLLYLPLRVGAFVWVFGSGLAALGTCLLLSAKAASWQRRLIVLAGIGFVPLFTTMNAGQVNNFVLVFTAAAIYAWQRKPNHLSGVWLALSLWLKPFTLLLPAVWLWRRTWSALLGLLIASFIITLAGIIAFGLTPTLTQFGSSGGLSPLNGLNSHPANQNFNGLLGRWLVAHEGGASLMNIPTLAVPVYLIVASSFVILTAWLIWTHGTTPQNFELQMALLTVTTHLVAPLTWYHHLAMLFIAFAVLLIRWTDWRKPSGAVIALGIVYALTGLYGLTWKWYIGYTILQDTVTWSLLVVWLLLVKALRAPAPQTTLITNNVPSAAV